MGRTNPSTNLWFPFVELVVVDNELTKRSIGVGDVTFGSPLLNGDQEKTLEKKECGYFEQPTSSCQKSSAILTVVGWSKNKAVYIAFSESFEPNRLVRRGNKVERTYTEEQSPN